ncbi:Cytochrome P450 20A1 [Lamellibrachia satsuma]|nr:Cytochrome P450 20A1 [Lamellibrachia satsuma]
MLPLVVYVGIAVVCAVIAVRYLYPGSKKATTVPGVDASDEHKGNLPDIQKAGSLHEFLMLADELVQKWRNIPGEEHIGLWEQMAAIAIKAMLQCSFGKYFSDDTAVNNMRRSYEVVMADMERRLDGSVPEEGSVREQTFQKQKDVILEILNYVMENYKNNLPSDARMTVIDVLSRSDMSDTEVSDDMFSVFVAGFHASALSFPVKDTEDVLFATYVRQPEPWLCRNMDYGRCNPGRHRSTTSCTDSDESPYKPHCGNFSKYNLWGCTCTHVSVMTWGLYFLATRPDVQLKIFNEIQQVVGCNEAGEQLKLYAPSRYEDVDSELGGHRIPAGTPVVHALGVVHQNQDLYPDPTTPENRKKLPAFAFEPFGFAGKRKCMGWKFSITEATIVFAAIVSSFKLSMVPDQVVVLDYGFVTKPSEEVWITVTKRS